MRITNTDGMWSLVRLELFLVVIIGLLVVSLFKKKKTYSWDKKSGANTALVMIAILLLIGFAIYLGIVLYQRNVIQF